MKWASTVSIKADVDENIRQCVANIRQQLGTSPDLALLFVSRHFAKDYEMIGPAVYQQLSCKVLIGCSAGGVVGAGKEVEGMPGISLTAGTLPAVTIRPFHVEQEELPSLDGSPRPWNELFDVMAKEEPHFLILADPFSISPEEWLSGLDFAFPKAAKVGGLASGAARPGGNVLFLNNACFASGMIGVALTGNVVLDTAVAQGCYPVGPVFRVTACEGNRLMELDDRPALEALAEVLSDLDPEEQERVQHSLFLGVVMDSMKESYAPGDFLIRNLMGADPEEGTVFVAARLHEGQAVQFHLRDAKTSDSDLNAVLADFSRSHEERSYSGAVLFSCMGRGQSLYGSSNHDAERFQHYFGTIPLGGFFCNGEIGPVGGVTYLHGYTSSFGLLGAKQ
jgi:small ligand-binding sensory domain FIST